MKKLENIEDVIDLVAVSLEKRDKLALDSLWDAATQIANWSGDCVDGGDKAIRLIKQAHATIEQTISRAAPKKVKNGFTKCHSVLMQLLTLRQGGMAKRDQINLLM